MSLSVSMAEFTQGPDPLHSGSPVVEDNVIISNEIGLEEALRLALPYDIVASRSHDTAMSSYCMSPDYDVKDYVMTSSDDSETAESENSSRTAFKKALKYVRKLAGKRRKSERRNRE